MTNTSENKIRIVTAASLFDGHDAAINIMRRILQSKGAEIIHLGHNRSVREIVEAAIEEDVQGIAITSYQGGHVEFFKYMKDLLNEAGCGHIKIFGGGGGTILPQEIEELHHYGITRIYSPDDGRKLGLEGMIQDVLDKCSPSPALPGGEGDGQPSAYWKAPEKWNGKMPLGEVHDIRRISRAITLAEEGMVGNHAADEENVVEDGATSYTVKHFNADPMLYGQLKAFALQHRSQPTEAEALLWEQLRASRLGFKFRRQHIIRQFIADFACIKKGLVVEIDGLYHQLPEMQVSDMVRTEALNRLGYEVIRFTNEQVLHDTENVL
ncbi:MAG TPA: DUF559 domain-containing protein, partial [Chitinophagaceae bacterium]|nr:DUF559 domain-containing protein [Chitinophagaceae bacterium]